MNYIYDIILNFNEVLYDFFDWNKNDKIIRIKKVPIFKVLEEDLINIISNIINIDINLIKNKTELYNFNCKKNCALFTDSNNIIALEFDDRGNSIKKSFLHIEEEEDVLDITLRFKIDKINYKIVEPVNQILKTRNETKELEFINKELSTISKDRLKYLYFECSNIELEDELEIRDKIYDIIDNNDKKYEVFYNMLKLTSKK